MPAFAGMTMGRDAGPVIYALAGIPARARARILGGNTVQTDLARLASLLAKRNAIDADISMLIGRPALQGHIGEYIAAHIFGIELMDSATSKAIDGHFRSGSLARKSVDVKFYGKQEALLDVREDAQPDYYLVLTGATAGATSSRGKSRPLVTSHVYLFGGPELSADIRRRGVAFGAAASVPKALWEAAELFPIRRCGLLQLTPEQTDMLTLFAGSPE
jgi:hypothetical protein